MTTAANPSVGPAVSPATVAVVEIGSGSAKLLITAADGGGGLDDRLDRWSKTHLLQSLTEQQPGEQALALTEDAMASCAVRVRAR
jgi:hypothetical protein